MRKSVLKLLIISIVFSTFINKIFGQNNSSPKNYFTIENYYKVKWGYADEFIGLWKKNHYPLLKKAQEKGDIISVKAEKPRYHSGEDTRWDFKVSIVFKNTTLAFDENLTTPYKAQLYSDTAQVAEDEQHRFELLIDHCAVMFEDVVL